MKKWTKEKIIKVSLKCQSLEDFKNKYKGAHWRAWKDGYLKKLTFPQTKSIWTKTNAFKEAKKYNNKKSFFNQSRGAYNFLYRNKMLGKATSHMITRFIWTKAKAFGIAKKYKNKSIFRTEQKGCHQWLSENNLLDEATSHMKGEIILFEKMDKKKFIEKLHKNNISFEEEFRVTKNSNHKIDFVMKINNQIYGIEYKSDKRWWCIKEIKNQINFYNRNLKKQFKNVKCLIVSPSGKYGMSENDFLKMLDKC